MLAHGREVFFLGKDSLGSRNALITERSLSRCPEPPGSPPAPAGIELLRRDEERAPHSSSAAQFGSGLCQSALQREPGSGDTRARQWGHLCDVPCGDLMGPTQPSWQLRLAPCRCHCQSCDPRSTKGTIWCQWERGASVSQIQVNFPQGSQCPLAVCAGGSCSSQGQGSEVPLTPVGLLLPLQRDLGWEKQFGGAGLV